MSIITRYRKTKAVAKRVGDSDVVAAVRQLMSTVNRSGQVVCFECGTRMDPRTVTRHLEKCSPEPKRQTTAPRNGARPKNPGKAKPATPANKKTPPEQKRKATKMTTAEVENGSDNPAQGLGEEIVKLMDTWASRLPANFQAAEREAETMAECWRGVADAFRRRAEQMVEVLGVDPWCVEPYDEVSGRVSGVADAASEVSNRIVARYKNHIEAANDPNAPNPSFVKEK